MSILHNIMNKLGRYRLNLVVELGKIICIFTISFSVTLTVSLQCYIT
jgi:hypothetical protein